MGVLTENGKLRAKLIAWLQKHGQKASVLAYLAGLIWMCALAHPQFNGRSYFSENALLPGVLQMNFRSSAQTMIYQEIEQMCAQSKEV